MTARLVHGRRIVVYYGTTGAGKRGRTMRHTLLALVCAAVSTVASAAFWPFSMFSDDATATSVSVPVTSNGVTKTRLGNLYRDNLVVIDVDMSKAQGGITNLVAGDNIIIEEPAPGTKKISAIGGGVSPEDVSRLIGLYDTTNVTPRIDAKLDITNAVTHIDVTNIVKDATNGIAQVSYVDAATNAVASNLVIVASNLVVVSMKADRTSLRLRDLYLSNTVESTILHGVTNQVDLLYASVSNINLRLPDPAPYQAVSAVSQFSPAFRVTASDGFRMDVLCTDGAYHDLKDTLSSAVGHPVMKYSVTNLYGHAFTNSYLDTLYNGLVSWTEGFTPTAANIDRPITDVCVVSGFPDFYGRTATVREVVCDILSRDSANWLDDAKVVGHERDYVPLTDVIRAVRTSLVYGRKAHEAAAQLRTDYEDGPVFGLPFVNVDPDVQATTTYVGVPHGVFASSTIPTGVSKVRLSFWTDTGSSRSSEWFVLLSFAEPAQLVLVCPDDGDLISVNPAYAKAGSYLVRLRRVAKTSSGRFVYVASVNQLDYQVVKPDFSGGNPVLVATINASFDQDNAEFLSGVNGILIPAIDSLGEYLTTNFNARLVLKLDDNYTALTNSSAFCSAVAQVSPPTDISGKQDLLPYPTNAIPSSVLREADPTVGLTNGTVYASGTNVTFLTEHQDLAGYRRKDDKIAWSDVTNSFAVSSNALGSVAVGTGSVAENRSNAFAAGAGTLAAGDYSFAAGNGSAARKPGSIALGTGANSTNDVAFVWNGSTGLYGSHGERTFNVCPLGGADGFWVGATNLTTLLASAGTKVTKVTDLTNDAGYVTSSVTNGLASTDYVNTGLSRKLDMESTNSAAQVSWEGDSLVCGMGNNAVTITDGEIRSKRYNNFSWIKTSSGRTLNADLEKCLPKVDVVAPTNRADYAGKAADAQLTGIALTNRYTKAETDGLLSEVYGSMSAANDAFAREAYGSLTNINVMTSNVVIGAGTKHVRTNTRQVVVGFAAETSASLATAVGGSARATDYQSTALGYNAKATAPRAVQIGAGENKAQDTLKFMDVMIVSNKAVVVGTVSPSADAVAGKAADARLTGIALSDRYTKDETDEKLAGKIDKIPRFSVVGTVAITTDDGGLADSRIKFTKEDNNVWLEDDYFTARAVSSDSSVNATDDVYAYGDGNEHRLTLKANVSMITATNTTFSNEVNAVAARLIKDAVKDLGAGATAADIVNALKAIGD